MTMAESLENILRERYKSGRKVAITLLNGVQYEDGELTGIIDRLDDNLNIVVTLCGTGEVVVLPTTENSNYNFHLCPALVTYFNSEYTDWYSRDEALIYFNSLKDNVEEFCSTSSRYPDRIGVDGVLKKIDKVLAFIESGAYFCMDIEYMSDRAINQILYIRDTGITNMFGVDAVCQIAEQLCFDELAYYIKNYPHDYFNFILHGKSA